MSRLTIDMTDQQHQSLKALALLQGKTLKQYALERLLPGDADADQAWKELKTLLSHRIHEGLTGSVSTKSISKILDEELCPIATPSNFTQHRIFKFSQRQNFDALKRVHFQ